MKKLVAKMRKIRMTHWDKLTFGEKIIGIVMSLVKIAAIVAVGALIIGVAVSVAAGVAIAFGIASAIAGGFGDASRAYRPGDDM